MSPRLVLASTSRYRRALLEGLGLTFESAAPDFVEDHAAIPDPAQMVVAFARGKALSLAARYPDALIIGSDQAAALGDRVLNKPGTAEAAVEQLLALAGRTHQLLTAVCVHDTRTDETHQRLVRHQMLMRPLDRAMAAAYVARDQPLDCAGAYKIESLGIALFEAMDGPDHTAIVGLPISVVGELLQRCGVDLLARALATHA